MAGDRGHGIDAGGLADLLGRHARRYDVPGAALGVLRDGVTVTACHGVADVRTGRPVTSSTPFSLGSLTKPIVASVLAELAAAGQLSFDDPLAARIPETSKIAWAQHATVRDLLGNRSGLPLTLDLEFGFDARTDEDDRALARFAAEIAAHIENQTRADTDTSAATCRPWSYTNAGWCLLGRAVEATTGATFESAAGERLASAGVVGIRFGVDGPIPDRVSGHDLQDRGPVPVPPLVNRAYAAAGTSATGGVDALLDLARWHLTAPGLAVLRETAAATSLPGWFDGWGLGWGRFDWSDDPVWGWDGMINGERTLLRLLPERQAAVALLANASSGRAFARGLLPELMKALFGIQIPAWHLEPVPGAAGDLSRFTGSYTWPDRLIEVTNAGDELRITEGDREVSARPLDDRTFALDPLDPDGPAVTFGAFGDDGRPHVVYDHLWGVPRMEGPSR